MRRGAFTNTVGAFVTLHPNTIEWIYNEASITLIVLNTKANEIEYKSTIKIIFLQKIIPIGQIFYFFNIQFSDGIQRIHPN